ncbi:hypothetical protein SK128_019335, partial [Halocaridina rubra]
MCVSVCVCVCVCVCARTSYKSSLEKTELGCEMNSFIYIPFQASALISFSTHGWAER